MRSIPFIALLFFMNFISTAFAETQWDIHGSPALDAVCLVNVLSGDPLVAEGKYYPDIEKQFGNRLNADTHAAIGRLGAKMKEQGNLVGPTLALYLSAAPDQSLDGFIIALRNTAALRESFFKTQFWSLDSWAKFDSVREDAGLALAGLKKAGYEKFWSQSVGPHINGRAEALRAEIGHFDLLGEQERLLGHDFPNRKIEVLLMRFCQPYGIRITGMRFLTDVDYPNDIVLRNAAHEPFHPPFPDPAPMKLVYVALQKDPFVSRAFAKHDPKYGYNSFEGYVDEDSVQVLEQIVSERLGFAADAATRWQEADGGMHVLAAALYQAMKDDEFDKRGGVYEEWLIDMVKSGRLAPGKLEPLAKRVLGVKGN